MNRPYLIGFALLLIVIAAGLWRPWEETREDWIRKTKLELSQRPAPPADFEKTLEPGQWAGGGYVLFENGWAAFASHTIHYSERIGDVALLRAADGTLYESRFHFCTGTLAFWQREDDPELRISRPRDIAHFLALYGEKHRWKRLADL